MTLKVNEKLVIAERESKFYDGLSHYIPQEALNYTSRRLAEKPVFLKISKNRKSKLGDFRAGTYGKPHTITINFNLNSYSFLVTLIHEMAHLECWLKYRNKVKPHGKEWKNEYRTLMEPLFEFDFLPKDLSVILKSYMNNPLASSCSDINLSRILKSYDENKELLYLEDIPEDSVFCLNNNRIFQKGIKRRKLYKCKDLKSKRMYLISPLCEVKLVTDSVV